MLTQVKDGGVLYESLCW